MLTTGNIRAALSHGARLLPFRFLAGHCTPVLTYHASFRQPPDDISAVDNITPQRLYDHLAELKRYYRFVPVDELLEASSLRGVASVTFDDGYKCVMDEALPVFESLDIPFTIFLTLSSLDQKTFWRHKVVYIRNHGLVDGCERHFRRTRKLPGEDFFAYLKNPANNSRAVEEEIDAFLHSRNIRLDGSRHLIDRESYLVDHPLIWYGNHSYNHYVLSSLSFEEQLHEIQSPKLFLAGRNLKTSGVFAPPFGEERHINRDTFTIVRELGYKGLALNRGRLTAGPVVTEGIRIIERFSPAESQMTWQCKKNWIKGLTPAREHTPAESGETRQTPAGNGRHR